MKIKGEQIEWAEFEIDIVKNNYSLDNGIEIITSLLPNRSRASIIAKAIRLKIPSIRKIKMLNWTSEEESILVQLYPSEGASLNLQKILGTTSGAIRERARKLKLKCLMVKNPKFCLRGQDNCNYRGYEELSGSYFKNLKSNAVQRNIVFDIDMEYLWNIFISQDKKCYYSGLPIFFSKSYKDERGTASLDRINSEYGYIRGNVQWVHKNINTIKWNLPSEQFIYYCNLVANKFPLSLDILDKK